MSCQTPLVFSLCAAFALALPVRAATGEPNVAPAVARNLQTLIPKQETGVPAFLQKHPTYDGRGVIIAVFDTGVDPTAAGLQKTTLGEPKVVDVIDTTGAGDVELAAPVKPGADGKLTGRTGRRLSLPEGIVNPKGEYRLGLKVARELFGSEVMERVREQLRRTWDLEKRELAAERARLRAADEKSGRRPTATKPESDLTPADRDMLARETLFDGWLEGFDPVEQDPAFDCVVWHDGTGWRVIVDTDADGDLRNEQVLRPYGIAQETGLFAGQTGGRFAVQIYDGGRVLSIVAVTGSHGTHVAGIAAAHFPEDPTRNGIAPGARILSVKIGDTRLGSSADGTGYLRALAACVQYKVDVMNMSFGGADAFQDGNNTSNRIIRRLVQDYGVTAFISAGNNGPALSTMGSPGDTPEVIGVGAYVSKDMAAALYAAPEGSAATTFGFSSRGPTKSGHLGVAILGPGAAFAPVAFDSLNRSQMMNGTSMSSPSVAGVGALLVSGAKQAGLKTSPARIKAALMNTARLLDDVEPWAQGPGLAQVGPAFEHLRTFQGIAAFDAHFQAETNDNTLAKGPGLYWRDARPAGRQEARFTVAPQFPEGTSMEARQAFEEDVILESTAPWLEVPKFLHLSGGSRPFGVRVTVPAAGAQGGVHYAEIRAIPARQTGAGPVFRIPVTVVAPKMADPEGKSGEPFPVDLGAGRVVRGFYQVPEGASHLRLRVRRDRSDLMARTYMLRATSLTSNESFREGQFAESLRLEPGQEREVLVPVHGGRTVELTWHQMWNSPSTSQLTCDYSWIGLSPTDGDMVITENQRYGTLVLRSAYAALPVEVSGKITDAIMLFAPVDSRTLPGDERDVLPPGPRDSGPVRLPLLRQKFEFKVEKAFKARLGDPRQSHATSELLGGITRIVHDSGRVLWHGGSRSTTDIDFPKGTITAYRDLRAIDPADARRQASRPLVLRRRIAVAPVLGVYPDASAAAKAKREGKLTLSPGRDHEIYIEEPADAALKELSPSPAWLLGEVEVVANKQTLLKVPVIFHRGVTPPDNKRPAGEPGKPKRTALEEAREELFQKQLSLVRPLRTKKDAESVAAHAALLGELRALRPSDPTLAYEQVFARASRGGLLESRTKNADKPTDSVLTAGDEKVLPAVANTEVKEPAPAAAKPDKPAESTSRESVLDPVLAEIAEGLSKIDAVVVAAFFGAPEAVPEDREARRVQAVKRKELTAQRDLLRDFALLRTEVLTNAGRKPEARAALLEAQRWEALPATPGKRWRELESALLKLEGHLGLALQSLQENALKEDPTDRGAREKRIALLRDLGWMRWAEHEARKLALEKGGVPVRF